LKIHSIIKYLGLFVRLLQVVFAIQRVLTGSVLNKSGFLEHLFRKTELLEKVFFRTFAH